MKLYSLYIDGVPAVCCKDIWLVELYITQRIKNNKYEIRKISAENYVRSSPRYLSYYFGYAVTNDELTYIIFREMDIRSLINKTKDFLKTKLKEGKISRKKYKKESKSLDKEHGMGFVQGVLDEIIDNPKLVQEYVWNVNSFQNYTKEM